MNTPDLWSLARTLPNPVDYEKGWATASLIIPERILAFPRSTRDRLLKDQARVKHHRFVLIVSLGGEGGVSVDQRVFHLKEKHCMLLFPFQFHHFLSFPQESIRWCFITFELKDPSLLEPLRNRIHLLTPELHDLLHRFLESAGTATPPLPSQVAQAQLRLALLLHQLLDNAPERFTSPPPTDLDDGALLLEKINRFLHLNISSSFTIHQLAGAVGYSASHLRNIFKESLHMSLGAYIREVRLRKATGLLHQGALSISEVSEACGYNSLFSFSRAFRKSIGSSPSEYKQRCALRISERAST
jgi:AraC-like DNA-binding protein